MGLDNVRVGSSPRRSPSRVSAWNKRAPVKVTDTSKLEGMECGSYIDFGFLKRRCLYTSVGRAFPKTMQLNHNRRHWMHKQMRSVWAGVCGLGMLTLCVVPSSAQMAEIKEKPPLYSYIANWQIPRAQWAEIDKANATDEAILGKALADGTIVGYGNDENLVHQPDGETHDDWWAATSMAGLMKVLDQFSTSGTAASPVLASATKHWDSILVSRYYNWHSGSWKGGYVSVASYTLKADAPDDAVDLLSKQLVAPLLEKMLADGTIREYEVDSQAIHTVAPGKFWIVYAASSAEGLDKVNAAIRDTLKEHPLSIPAFDSMVEYSAHRDELLRGNGVYK